MRLAFVADTHVANHKRFGGTVESGLNQRCRQVLAALERAAIKSSELGCTAFIIAGDLVDTTRPEPQVIAAIQSVLEQGPADRYLLLGNHDQVSEQAGDHALGPFAPVSQVVDTPRWSVNMSEGAGVLFIPFQPGDARVWLPKVIAAVKEPVQQLAHRVLVLHLGLMGDDVPAYLKDAHDAVPVSLLKTLCKKHQFEAVFAGNWHFHKVHCTDPMIVQIGTLAPTGWDNPGIEGQGSLVVWDTATMTMTRTEIPGPRFVNLTADDPVPIVHGDDNLYLRIKAMPEQVADCVKRLNESGNPGEVVPDDVEARAAARSAAVVARSAQTLDEALAGFVGQMALPDGVTRDEVLASSKKYLGG